MIYPYQEMLKLSNSQKLTLFSILDTTVLTCGDDPVCNTPEDPTDNPDCPDIGGSVCDTPCAGKEAGLYQVPGTNRQQYVNCFNGEGVVQTCGTDLVFDSVLKVCNLKASATCGVS